MKGEGMREIKFRAWDEEDESMVDWGIIIDDGFHKYLSCELMQFTGLKDKNGKEVYEGDVVKTHFAGEDLIGEIEYVDKWAKFCFGALNKHGCGIAFDPESVFYWYYAEDDEEGTSICEVIGNIYETPQILGN